MKKRLKESLKVETVLASNDVIKNLSQPALDELMGSLDGLPVLDKDKNIVGHVISSELRSNIDSCEILGTIELTDTAALRSIRGGMDNDNQPSISCTKSNP